MSLACHTFNFRLTAVAFDFKRRISLSFCECQAIFANVNLYSHYDY